MDWQRSWAIRCARKMDALPCFGATASARRETIWAQGAMGGGASETPTIPTRAAILPTRGCAVRSWRVAIPRVCVARHLARFRGWGSCAGDDDLVFALPDGTRFGSLAGSFDKVLRRAGLGENSAGQEFKFHSLRHFHAVQVLARDIDVFMVARNIRAHACPGTAPLPAARRQIYMKNQCFEAWIPECRKDALAPMSCRVVRFLRGATATRSARAAVARMQHAGVSCNRARRAH